MILNNAVVILPIVFGSIGILTLVALFIVLFYLVIRPNSYKKQLKDLERKYSYLDALLLGQDSQYIHRLEMISRSNLLYLEKYNEFSKKFRDIFDGDDKFAESMFSSLRALIANKQYKKVKEHLPKAKNAVMAFEEHLMLLDKELTEVIRPEEEARQDLLVLRENYRRVKQTFHANSNDLEIVADSFVAVFEKIDQNFEKIENAIECADYDTTKEIIPFSKRIIAALDNALETLPNICIFIKSIIPTKINEISEEYKEVEKQGIPLFNLSFKQSIVRWNKTLKDLQKQIVTLKTNGAMETLEKLEKEIEEVRENLHKEIRDRDEFNQNSNNLYKSAIEIEKIYVKICSSLPQLRETYIITSEAEERILILKDAMDALGGSKRNLDNYMHSGTKQPYSVLMKKLEDLKKDYDSAYAQILSFKSYVDSLKTTTEEAYNMIFGYYYRCCQTEALLKEMNIQSLIDESRDSVESIYQLLNDIDKDLKIRPIDVDKISLMVKELKTVAVSFFESIEKKNGEMHLAEAGIVYANRDRNHQSDVHQQLLVLEQGFFNGDFLNVYNEANAIYNRFHVEQPEEVNK